MTIVPDPGVLLNLLASECLSKIQKGMDISVVIPEQSICSDLLFGEQCGTLAQVRAQLSSEKAKVDNLAGDEENDLFIHFASLANEGEAAAAAMAAARGFILATDDTLLRTAFHHSVNGRASTLSTIALFRQWDQVASPADMGLSVALLRERAGFDCSPDDPDIQWWKGFSRTPAPSFDS